MVQRNFILTDVMKTGQPDYLLNYIKSSTLSDQDFTCTEEYYTLHNHDLKNYDRRFAIIDMNFTANTYLANEDYQNDLAKRLKKLQQQDFVFILGCAWESKNNVQTQNWINAEWTQPGDRNIPYEHYVWTGGTSWFWSYMQHRHKNKTFDFDHATKKFNMLYLNKYPREHRLELYNKIKHNGLLNNSLHSFVRLKDPVRLPSEYELPWVDREKYPLVGMDQDLFEKPYNDTKYSLISETNDTNDEIFITEKIWKCILAKHVFVVHGNYQYLNTLQSMGFKTFSHVIDETYDNEIDQDKRINKIVQTCKTLNDLDSTKLYQDTVTQREHNFKTFFDKTKLANEINKELRLWLEFADCSQVSSTES